MKKVRNTEARWIESRSRWQVNVTGEEGKRKTFVSSTPGRKGKLQAERKADDWLEESDKQHMRLDDAWQKFEKAKALACGQSWLNKINSVYRIWIAPELKYKRLERITPAEWKRCIDAAYAAGRARKTLENIRGVLTAFFEFCESSHIKIDRPRKLPVPKGATVGQRSVLSTKDIRTLFTDPCIVRYGKPCQAFYIYAWRLIVTLGLRRGELAGLQYSDIDEQGILRIGRSVNTLGEVTTGKTENAQRSILLPEHAKKIIADQCEMLRSLGIATGTWIFPAPDGNMMDPNAMYKQWYTYRKQHGIEASLHELRHTLVSLVKSELPEDLLKQMVGHSDAMDTSRYKHIVDGDMQRTSKVIEGVFSHIL